MTPPGDDVSLPPPSLLPDSRSGAMPAGDPSLPRPATAAPGFANQGPRGLVAALALVGALAVAALATAVLAWQKLSGMQEQLARQSQDAGAAAIEARTLARGAQEIARDTASRQALTEGRLAEVALQRTQLEDLMQSLSRSRDETLVVDIESQLRLAQQQAQLTLSVEPLVAALRVADQRIARAAQPRLSRVRAAIARDAERIRAAGVADIPSLLLRLEDLARQVDDWPAQNGVRAASGSAGVRPGPDARSPDWWRRAVSTVVDEARGLVRVSRIDQPEAALLAPDQTFFLRENVKLKLLNARLALLARQNSVARADVQAVVDAVNRWFDPTSRKTQAAATLLQQVQAQLKVVELPPIDDTLAALATAAGSAPSSSAGSSPGLAAPAPAGVR